jgi:hypothetical protein
MRRARLRIASFGLHVLAAGGAGAATAQPVAVTIDAARTAPPITPLVFGGFMEPATTRVWAEMLYDRKFFNRVTSQPDPAAPQGGFGRRGPLRRWLPVGPDAFVEMDRSNAYAGEWSPRVRLEAASPHGLSQSGLALRAGRKRMAISVVNPTETSQECELSLLGVKAGGPAHVFLVTAPPGAAPAPAGPGSAFSGPPATMAASTLPEAPRRITLPPASLTVYEFDVL